MLKSIPTEYNGIQYRSRLEARWALFFDICGFKYKYEEVGTKYYVPDFFLDNEKVYVEVKGDDEYLHKCLGKMVRFCREEKTGLIILGNFMSIKELESFDIQNFPVYSFIAHRSFAEKFCNSKDIQGYQLFDGVDDVLNYNAILDPYRGKAQLKCLGDYFFCNKEIEITTRPQSIFFQGSMESNECIENMKDALRYTFDQAFYKKDNEEKKIITEDSFKTLFNETIDDFAKSENKDKPSTQKTTNRLNGKRGNPHIRENAKKYHLGRKKGTKFSPPAGYVSANELAKITGYSAAHLKKLAREGKMESELFVNTIFNIDRVVLPKFGERVSKVCHALRIVEGKVG